MKQLLKATNWYKGNLHTHTTRSDGQITPEEAIEIYRKAGYDFLALTDHRKPSATGQYKNMLLISGAEWDYGNNTELPVYHILALGTEDDLGLPPFYEQGILPVRKDAVVGEHSEKEDDSEIGPQEIVDRIRKAGGRAILAHPAWSLMNPADMFELSGFMAAEIYNSVSADPWNAHRADSAHYFDLWASKGTLVQPVASDDSHWYTGEQTYSYTMVGAQELTQEAILEAIEAGNAYASQGPRFSEIVYDDADQKVYIRCSEDVERIIVYSNSVWVDKRVYDKPKGEAVYKIAPQDRYFRVELVDAEGRRAWSRPYQV